MRKRVLVTGGAGFIGATLVRHLWADGAEVQVLDDLSCGQPGRLPAAVELVVGSVTDVKLVRALIAQVDVCFHLAAVASVETCRQDLISSHQTNITGFIAVLDAIRMRDIRPVFVYASSAAVYGALEALPLREDGPVQPLSAYGADKYGCELHARAALEAYGVASTGLRFFNVYGEGQDPQSPYSGVISKFIDAANNGEPLTVFGDGVQTRDFVHVDDVVDALMRLGGGHTKKAAVLNVCTGQATAIVDLARLITAQRNPSGLINHAPSRLGEVQHSRGSTEALRAATGLLPCISLEEGLSRLQ